jgi:YVTN family beta-propeller protein
MRRRATAALAVFAVLLVGCRHQKATPTAARVVTVPIAGRPSAVTVAGGMVWVADDERGEVVTVDQKTARVVGAPIKVGPSPVALAADDTTVWVADASGTLTGITIRDQQPDLAPTTIGGTLSGIAVADGELWITDVENGRLWPRAVGYRPGGPTPPIQIPQGAVRVAVDGSSVWVTNGEDTVTRVDATTRAVDPPITVGTGPIGVAARNGVVWVANSDDDDVSRLVPGTTGPLAATKVAKAPIGVAVGADGAWVISQDARRLTRLDATTGKVRGSTSIATRPRGIALGTDRVWIVGVEPNVVVGVLRSALGA